MQTGRGGGVAQGGGQPGEGAPPPRAQGEVPTSGAMAPIGRFGAASGRSCFQDRA